MTILDTIGRTRLVPLRHSIPEGSARILLKAEYENPTGRDTGPGFVMPLWQDGLADEILTVSSEEAMATARRLAREEAIFAGTSTGANVAAALRVAERLGAGHRQPPPRHAAGPDVSA